MNKKQGVLIGIALVLLSTGIALATSSASSDVVIYAFDQNPAGSDKGNEWVTLHNPSNESVDIGNWILETADGDTIDVSFDIYGIQRIRLVGVNTPEIGEEGYEEANEFVTVSCSNSGDQIYMILRLLCCVTGAAIVIAQIFSQIGWSPIYGRRIRKAVQQMRGLSQAIKDEADNKIYKYEAGLLYMNDAGFKELVNVLKWKRLLPEGEILEMTLYHGNLPPNFKATMLSPNAVMGVIYRSNSGKNFRPIIFHPFDIGLTLSLEELKNWTKEYLIVRMGYLTSILVVFWTTIGLIAIFKG